MERMRIQEEEEEEVGGGKERVVRCASNATSYQFDLSGCMPLRCCKAVISHSLCLVLCNTFSMSEHEAQAVLSLCTPLRCCEAVPSHSLCLVLCNT